MPILTSIIVLSLLVATVVSIIDYVLKKVLWSPKFKVEGKTVLISGGSMGIGKALAKEAIQRGAKKVYILARNDKTLQEAKEDILSSRVNDNQTVVPISCDVTQLDQVKKVRDTLESECETFDFLIINQGMAEPGYFLEQEESIFKRAIDVNYLGGVYLTKALLPLMLRLQSTSDDSKHIVYVSSALGLLTMFGYSSYCPSKYAIRAFAECLNAELQSENIYVHCSAPVDTQTPGFSRENETKPIETVKLSETGGLASPESTAKAIFDQMKSGRFLLTTDFVLKVTYSITRGIYAMYPVLVLDWLFTVVSAAIAPLVRLYFWYIPYSLKSSRKQRFEALTASVVNSGAASSSSEQKKVI